MANLRIFTWNMQRGSSIGFKSAKSKDARIRREARFKLLSELCQLCDIGFITEPGKDLINAVTTPNTTSLLCPQGFGFWNASLMKDGQSDRMPCRNLIFSKYAVDYVRLPFESGQVKKFRYPAACRLIVESNISVLLATIHATSGGGGWDNSRELLEFIRNDDEVRHFDCSIFGGDMNSNHSYFHMPRTPTHQSGHTLDGFMHDIYNEGSVGVTVSKPSVLQRGILLEKSNATYYKGMKSGFNFASDTGFSRVSDHAPVLADVIIKKEFLKGNPFEDNFSEFSNNILRRERRVRRPTKRMREYLSTAEDSKEETAEMPAKKPKIVDKKGIIGFRFKKK